MQSDNDDPGASRQSSELIEEAKDVVIASEGPRARSFDQVARGIVNADHGIM